MRYYVAPNGTNFSLNHWTTPGTVPGDLVTTVSQILANPSPTGDEIWAVGDSNVLGAQYQGIYSLTTPLSIVGNTAPLSIYGGFAGWENTLCDRNAKIDSQGYPNFFPNPSILDGGGINRVIYLIANVCRIDGFVIRNGNAATAATGLYGGGMVAGGRNIWLENLVFVDNLAMGDGGGIFATAFGLMIKNSIFFRNQASNGGGLGAGDGSNMRFVNLLFNDNQTVGTAGNGDAIYLMGDTNVQIINNTISGNTTGSSSVYCTSTTTNIVEIYNSIIYPDNLVAASFVVVRVEYCCLGSNPVGTLPLTPTSFIGTPNFIGMGSLSATGNFHLQASSPCINMGNTDLIFPLSATDLEGYPRFIGGNPPPFPTIEVDMGALEVQ